MSREKTEGKKEGKKGGGKKRGVKDFHHFLESLRRLSWKFLKLNFKKTISKIICEVFVKFFDRNVLFSFQLKFKK